MKKKEKLYKMLEDFYKEPLADLCDKKRRLYYSAINNKFIPFLKQEKIRRISQISKYTLRKFQDVLTEKVKPQTVNDCLKSIRRIFRRLERNGIVENNPCDSVKPLKVRENDCIVRGCHELDKINGVFNTTWESELLYLLCLIIYTTGLRNSEITKLKMEDIKLIDNCRFISVNTSKTANGIRLVPLHDFVYKKIKAWTQNKNSALIFNKKSQRYFWQANKLLGKKLGMTEDELKNQKITFYSGRHFYKTLMSAEYLGEEIEELWMGHKVSGNVKKSYNHRDKIGKGRMINKAEQLFEILDRCIFACTHPYQVRTSICPFIVDKRV